jgi:hypothetical protein
MNEQNITGNGFDIVKVTFISLKWVSGNPIQLSSPQESLESDSSLFLYFLVGLLLPTHCRCRGLLLHLITLNDTYKFSRTPWKRNRPVAEGSACTTHNIHERQISMPPAGLEPAVPPSDQQQTYALDGAATRIGEFDSENFKTQVAVLAILFTKYT